MSKLFDLLQGIITKVNSIRGGDWNQSDPSATNYIQNRTHYEDPTIGTEVLAENITINSNGSAVSHSVPLDLDEWYLVVWDGVIYKCQYQDWQYYSGDGTMSTDYFLGNFFCLPSSSATGPRDHEYNSDMPFSFCFDSTPMADMLYATEEGEHTYSVYHIVDEVYGVKPLDEKFLPASQITSAEIDELTDLLK